MNSSFRNNLESIKNDVSNLFKKIDDPNEKLFNHSMNTDIRINGYQDPSNLYRNQIPNESKKVLKELEVINKQNLKLSVGKNLNNLNSTVPQNERNNSNDSYDYDNRKHLYPTAEINNFKDISKAYILNESRQPYLSASIRDTQLVEDVLLNQSEIERLQKNRENNKKPEVEGERSKSRSKSSERKRDESENREKKKENFAQKDPRDSRFIYYPNQQEAELEMPKNTPFQTVAERKTSNMRAPTGDVFTHNSQRDRVPINPNEEYRSSYNQSTPYNTLDFETTHDTNKRLIIEGELNYPTGDVFTHNAQRDRVPINPIDNYRSSDYASTPYNSIDLDVDNVPRTSAISGTADYILNREFEIVNNNKTSKDEQNEKTMIHTPYTELDKFGKSNVIFKNINEEKPQVDVLNEYIVSIDSADRDIKFYPNQFKLRVLFNPTNVNSADLQITRAFENIKYLRLETTTFPRYYRLSLTTYDNVPDNIVDLQERTIVSDIINQIPVPPTPPFTAADFYNYIQNYVPSTSGYYLYYVDYTPFTQTFNVNIKYTNPKTNKSEIINYEFKYQGPPPISTLLQNYKLTIKRYKINITDPSTVLYYGEQKIINDISNIIYLQDQLAYDDFINNFSYSNFSEIESVFPTPDTDINAKFTIINSSNESIAYEITYTNGNVNKINRYTVDTTKDLSTDRFTQIYMDEITENTQNSTSGKNQYNYLYPDYIAEKYFYGDNHFVDKIYKNAKLGTIQNLTIHFTDSFGKQIQGDFNKIDQESSSPDKTCNCDDDTQIYNCTCNYIRHPYYRDFQLCMMFKVGCYETEIDKKIFY